MKTNNPLELLPTYRMQMCDLYRILHILLLIPIVCNICLSANSNNLTFYIIILFFVVSVLSLILFHKYFEAILKKGSVADFYIGAGIEYILLMIGYIPILFYLFIEQEWSLFDNWGLGCLFLFNRYYNWPIPLAVFLLLTITYWLILILLYKQSTLYQLLYRKKEGLYE